jgi:S1-C subfamily serine protease
MYGTVPAVSSRDAVSRLRLQPVAKMFRGKLIRGYMFVNAIKKARRFTLPIVSSYVNPDGSLGAGVGACIVVNKDGWVLTANHILQGLEDLQRRKDAFDSYQATVADIQQDKGLLPDQKVKKIRKLGGFPKGAIMDFAVLWGGQQGCSLDAAHTSPANDLALCKLTGFDAAQVETAVFKDPADGVDPGTSICRLGFPFMKVQQSYSAGVFTIDLSNLAFFPNEGMMTREIETPPFGLMIETSSAGLKGQSGGPLFDTNGTVWAIQSLTGHIPLGFSPPVPGGSAGQVEHQFLNLGRGAHPKAIVELLKAAKVNFELSTY